jgi:hypothetical protein
MISFVINPPKRGKGAIDDVLVEMGLWQGYSYAKEI